MGWPILVKRTVAKERIQRVRFNWVGASLANKPEHTRRNGEIPRREISRLGSGPGEDPLFWNAGEREGSVGKIQRR
jgi:hypothetical protein